MGDKRIQLPRYRCHKVVQAAKITRITDPPKGLEHSGKILSLSLPPDAHGRERPQLFIFVTMNWIERHSPRIGGYYVVYKDGYASFSPAEAFEEGYTLIE